MNDELRELLSRVTADSPLPWRVVTDGGTGHDVEVDDANGHRVLREDDGGMDLDTATLICAAVNAFEHTLEIGIRIGVAEERARVARENLKKLRDLARGGAFVLGTYDAEHHVAVCEGIVAELRSQIT